MQQHLNSHTDNYLVAEDGTVVKVLMGDYGVTKDGDYYVGHFFHSCY